MNVIRQRVYIEKAKKTNIVYGNFSEINNFYFKWF